MTAMGRRAFRRGAPGPQGALRPLGLRSDAGIRRFGLALAAHGRNAPSGSPSSRAPLTPPTARERLHWAAPRGRRHSAVSRAVGSRCGLPNAPSGSPSEALRSPSRWAGKICIAAYKPSPLRFACRNDLALRTGAGGGRTARYGSLSPDDGPLTTVRSHQKSPTADYLACMQCCGFTRIVDSPMNVGFACGPVRDSRMDASPRQRRSAHSGRRY